MSRSLVTLSSRLTFVQKVVFPIVWIGGFGIATAALWIGEGSPDQMKWGFFAALIVGSLFIWFTCAPLKRVRIDDGVLRISNYLKEIEAPLGIIEHVSENRWINIHPVTLHLRRPTEFGDKIVFMPRMKFMLLWRSHPVVGEITRMAEAASAERPA